VISGQWTANSRCEQATDRAGGQQPVRAGEVAAEDVAADGEAGQGR